MIKVFNCGQTVNMHAIRLCMCDMCMHKEDIGTTSSSQHRNLPIKFYPGRNYGFDPPIVP